MQVLKRAFSHQSLDHLVVSVSAPKKVILQHSDLTVQICGVLNSLKGGLCSLKFDRKATQPIDKVISMIIEGICVGLELAAEAPPDVDCKAVYKSRQ